MNPGVLRPDSTAQACAMLREALARNARLRIQGAGSLRAIGAPHDATCAVLDMSALDAVIDYAPQELVITARAGAPVAHVEALLAQQRQHLAFDPTDYRRVLGQPGAGPTLGGVLGSGWAGPRRLGAGNVRDHLLGFEAVAGHGEVFRAGGRVIKNVTGYDLSKLMVGAWGTLAALTEVSLRVQPRAEREATLVVRGRGASLLPRLVASLGATADIACAAQLPDGRALLRIEGFEASVQLRLRTLHAQWAAADVEITTLHDAPSAALWRAVRDLDAFADDARPIWRISLPPASALETITHIQARAACSVQVDWGGALLWLAMDDDELAAGVVREAAARAGGHAWLFRATPAQRATVATAPPLAPGLRALSTRVRDAFDPRRVFHDGPLCLDPARAC